MDTHSPRLSQLEGFLRLVRLFLWTLWVIYRERRRVMQTHALVGRAAQSASPALLQVLAAIPYARSFLGLDGRGMEQTAQQLLGQALTAGRALLTLPQAVEQVLSKPEAGELEVAMTGLEPGGRRSVRGSGSVKGSGPASALPGFTWPFMFTTSLVGGIVLLTDTHQLGASWFCLALAGLCAVRAWVKS